MAVRKQPTKPDNTTTALANWDEELAKHAQEASDVERQPGGNFISVRGGLLQVNGAAIEGNKMEVIVLDSVYENVFYEGDFDPDNPSSPKCFAFGHTEDEMAPVPDDVPERISDACAGCPNNEWGTASKGKGKACKNVKRLALISYNALTPDKVEEAEIFYLKVSVTNVKQWAHFVKTVANTLRRPPFGVVTEISVTPDPKSQFRLMFKPVANLGPEFMGPIMAKHEEAKQAIAFPYAKYVAPAEDAPPAKPAKRKF